MSGTADERLIVMLEARISEFEKRMGQAERRGTRTYQGLQRNSRTATRAMEQDMVRSTTRINQALASTSARIGTFGRAFIGGLAAGAATAAIGAVTTGLRQTVRAIAAVGDEARRAGLGVEEFQQWAYVANQNRVAVDALVDGFKELNLRADEWITTGSGPAAEAFARLGFSSDDLARRLEEPSELMLEIFDRLRRFETAEQIRIFDEILGGTGGERFVQLIAQGEAGLRRTMQRAHEVGAVLDSEMIDRAAEIDRRFGEIAATLANMGKGMVVSVADAIATVLGLADEMEAAFNERRDRIVGEAAGAAVDATDGAAAAISETLDELMGAYNAAGLEAETAATRIEGFIDLLGGSEYDEVAELLQQMADRLRTVAQGFNQGEVDGETFRTTLEEIAAQAGTTLEGIRGIDEVDLDNASRVINALTDRLRELQQQASSTAAAVAAATITPARQVGSFWDTEESRFSLNRLAPNTSPRPRAAPTDPDFGLPPVPSGGGSGGGGSEGYAAAVADIQARTQALEMEAATLVAAAASNMEYGVAIDYARARAQLMNEATEEGRTITPELQAEIDQLALAYVTAGQSAEDAADSIQQVQAASERGIDAATDVFTAFGRSADEGRAAVARLIMEIVRMQAMRGFQALAGGGGGGGGLFAFLGGSLGGGMFDEGGYTGDGGTHEPKGIVHGGEYVFSKKATQAIGVARLERMHLAAKGYASGGYVGVASTSASAPAAPAEVVVRVLPSGEFDARVADTAATVVRVEGPGMVRGEVAGGGVDRQMGSRFGALVSRMRR